MYMYVYKPTHRERHRHQPDGARVGRALSQLGGDRVERLAVQDLMLRSPRAPEDKWRRQHLYMCMYMYMYMYMSMYVYMYALVETSGGGSTAEPSSEETSSSKRAET